MLPGDLQELLSMPPGDLQQLLAMTPEEEQQQFLAMTRREQPESRMTQSDSSTTSHHANRWPLLTEH
jgi:hypothetical protein